MREQNQQAQTRESTDHRPSSHMHKERQWSSLGCFVKDAYLLKIRSLDNRVFFGVLKTEK